MSINKKEQFLSEMLIESFECQQKGEYDKAISILNKMIEIEPANSDAHHYLGLSYMQQHNFNKAISEMELAIRLSPNLDNYYNNLGLTYWKTKQREKSIECFRKGYKLNENNRFIHFNLTQVLFDAGQIEQSLSECYKYLEKYSYDYYVFFMLILIEYRLCRKDIVLPAAIEHQKRKNISVEKWLDSIPETDNKLLFTKGVLCILFKNIHEGIRLLKQSEKKLPGAGWIFTYKIITQINQNYSANIDLRIKEKNQFNAISGFNGIISMNDLGIIGRFGHEIYYYLGLKLYAKKHNYRLEVTDWLGRYLFEGCNDSFISGIYDTIDSGDPLFTKSIEGRCPPPKKKFNLRGGCFRMPQTVEDKNYLRKLLKLKLFWREKLDPCVANLRKHHKTLLTIHVRRGDYIKDGYYVPSSQLYLEWLATIWPSLDRPVLYIASDEAERVHVDFWKFNPFIGKYFGNIFLFDDFLTDFYIMSQSDILVIGTSSFSRIAALCNENYTGLYWTNPKNNRIEPLNN